jgi:hypothetical protein
MGTTRLGKTAATTVKEAVEVKSNWSHQTTINTIWVGWNTYLRRYQSQRRQPLHEKKIETRTATAAAAETTIHVPINICQPPKHQTRKSSLIDGRQGRRWCGGPTPLIAPPVTATTSEQRDLGKRDATALNFIDIVKRLIIWYNFFSKRLIIWYKKSIISSLV